MACGFLIRPFRGGKLPAVLLAAAFWAGPAGAVSFSAEADFIVTVPGIIPGVTNYSGPTLSSFTVDAANQLPQPIPDGFDYGSALDSVLKTGPVDWQDPYPARPNVGETAARHVFEDVTVKGSALAPGPGRSAEVMAAKRYALAFRYSNHAGEAIQMPVHVGYDMAFKAIFAVGDYVESAGFDLVLHAFVNGEAVDLPSGSFSRAFDDDDLVVNEPDGGGSIPWVDGNIFSVTLQPDKITMIDVGITLIGWGKSSLPPSPPAHPPLPVLPPPTATPVPLPGAGALALLALGMLGAMSRRRR